MPPEQVDRWGITAEAREKSNRIELNAFAALSSGNTALAEHLQDTAELMRGAELVDQLPQE